MLQNPIKEYDSDWQANWEMAYYSIWFLQNQREHVEDYVMPIGLTNDIVQRMKIYKSSITVQDIVAIRLTSSQQIKWQPPIDD